MASVSPFGFEHDGLHELPNKPLVTKLSNLVVERPEVFAEVLVVDGAEGANGPEELDVRTVQPIVVAAIAHEIALIA